MSVSVEVKNLYVTLKCRMERKVEAVYINFLFGHNECIVKSKNKVYKVRKSFAFHITNTQETLSKNKKKRNKKQYFCIILNFNEQRMRCVCVCVYDSTSALKYLCRYLLTFLFIFKNIFYCFLCLLYFSQQEFAAISKDSMLP